MANIKVDPDYLRNTSKSLKELSRAMAHLAKDGSNAGNSAPSYEGQFRSRVSLLGSGVTSQLNRKVTELENYANRLEKTATRFEQADNSYSGSLSWSDLLRILREGGLKGVFDALNKQRLLEMTGLLGLGALFLPPMPWNPNPVFGSDGASAINPNPTGFKLSLITKGEWWKKILRCFIPIPYKYTIVGSPHPPSPVMEVATKEIQEEPEIKLDYFLKQSDELWKKDPMGTNGRTIGDAGCLITTIAMVARKYGANVTPRDINEYLRNNNGYTAGTSYLNRNPNKAVEFLEKETGLNFEYQEINTKQLNQNLLDDKPAIMHVINRSNKKDPDGHWVLVTGFDKSGNYEVVDAATGKPDTYKPSELLSGHKIFNVI